MEQMFPAISVDPENGDVILWVETNVLRGRWNTGRVGETYPELDDPLMLIEEESEKPID